MADDTLPRCPVCDEIDDCRHLLVEWYLSPGERVRGALLTLLKSKESGIEQLLVECCRAGVPPRHPGLLEAYETGRDYVLDSDIVISEEDLRGEIGGAAIQFVLTCLRAAPGVIQIEVEGRRFREFGVDRYVSLWAADPVAARQYLLDILAPLEVQLDQFYFERGETPRQWTG